MAGADEPPESEFHLGLIESTEAIRSAARAWDDLWDRSETTAPTARARLVALWVDHFRPGALFRGLTVAENGRLVAALPLVGRRFLRLIRAGTLPCNVWAASGDLLLDPEVDAARALDRLVSGISTLPWRCLVMEHVAYEQPRWRALLAAMDRAGLCPAIMDQHRVGQVDISQDWEAYFRQRKSRHRQRLRRYRRMLESAGRTELEVYSEIEPQALETLLRRGFEVEDRSWKAGRGTSALRAPGIYAFLLAEARELAACGHLELVFLELGAEPIAFHYGWKSKGVHFWVKVGYDESFSRFGPGQQQTWRLLERLHADAESRLLDFYGPLVPWSEVWATRSYPVGRVIATPPHSLSRALCTMYGTCRAPAKRAQQRLRKLLNR